MEPLRFILTLGVAHIHGEVEERVMQTKMVIGGSQPSRAVRALQVSESDTVASRFFVLSCTYFLFVLLKFVHLFLFLLYFFLFHLF